MAACKTLTLNGADNAAKELRRCAFATPPIKAARTVENSSNNLMQPTVHQLTPEVRIESGETSGKPSSMGASSELGGWSDGEQTG